MGGGHSQWGEALGADTRRRGVDEHISLAGLQAGEQGVQVGGLAVGEHGASQATPSCTV